MTILHNFPEAYSEDYRVMINGSEARPFAGRVSAMPYNCVWPGHQRPESQTETASYVSFESSEQFVELEVEPKRAFTECALRPLSKAVAVSRGGNRLKFRLPVPGQYSLELDGEHRPLLIFANPPAAFGEPKPGDLHYSAGEHRVGSVTLTSGQTVFIDAGAVVYGSFTAICEKNVRVCGYGIIDGSAEKRTDETLLLPYDMDKPIPRTKEGIKAVLASEHVLNGCVRFYACENVSVEGVILRDSASFAVIPAACGNVLADNIKMCGMWRYNCDGLDFFNCSGGLVKNSFFRNFDDCIVIKGIKGWDERPNENILVSGCVVWCDWGRALEFGAETCAPEYRNIRFENCDVIRASHIALDIQNGDRAKIHNVVFEDIRVEYSRHNSEPEYQHNEDAPYSLGGKPYSAELMKAHLYRGVWSHDNLFGENKRVLFRNISVLADDGVAFPRSEFSGADEEHLTSEVTIEGVSLNGSPVAADKANIELGKFTEKITYNGEELANGK